MSRLLEAAIYTAVITTGLRTFIATGSLAAVALLSDSTLAEASIRMNEKTAPINQTVRLLVNGTEHAIEVDTRMSLLDALREQCGLTGSKKGCDHGQCGACTILIEGERHLSCLTLTIASQGQQITTIEGLAQAGQLHPLQQAFIDHDAFQCGYCTSGQIMSAVACIREGNADTDANIREYMSGNLCRCAAYPNIVAAVRQAKLQMEKR